MLAESLKHDAVHLLAYYRWNTRHTWRLNSLDRDKSGRLVMRYIYRDVGAWKKYAREDAVLWVVGLSPDGQPTLDACIHIDDTYPRWKGADRWRGISGPRPPSRFFGLNDASEAMARIAFLSGRKGTWRLDPTDDQRTWSSQHGGRLQNILRIAPAGLSVAGQVPSFGTDPLSDLARAASQRSIFISYKHDDMDDESAREFLIQLAVELARKKIAVWLDRLALAGTGGQKQPQESDSTLTELLQQGLGDSRVVLGVWRDLYGTLSKLDRENWTQKEWRGIGHGTKRVALDPSSVYRARQGLHEPNARVRLPATPNRSHAEAIAGRIARVCRPLWKRT